MPIFKFDSDLIENNKHLFNENDLINEMQIKNDSSVKSLKFANKDLIKQFITNSNNNLDSIEVLNGKSDLISNQYEGGFKVWEGLKDLINYFIEFNVLKQYSCHQTLNVLEVIVFYLIINSLIPIKHK